MSGLSSQRLPSGKKIAAERGVTFSGNGGSGGVTVGFGGFRGATASSELSLSLSLSTNTTTPTPPPSSHHRYPPLGDSIDPALLPTEIACAYRDARDRGLPTGWTVSIDKRNRRKWTAPNNGRSCDSIPKALGISIELGLLPPDTYIPTGSTFGRMKKQQKQQKQKKRIMMKRKRSNSNSDDELDNRIDPVTEPPQFFNPSSPNSSPLPTSSLSSQRSSQEAAFLKRVDKAGPMETLTTSLATNYAGPPPQPQRVHSSTPLPLATSSLSSPLVNPLLHSEEGNLHNQVMIQDPKRKFKKSKKTTKRQPQQQQSINSKRSKRSKRIDYKSKTTPISQATTTSFFGIIKKGSKQSRPLNDFEHSRIIVVDENDDCVDENEENEGDDEAIIKGGPPDEDMDPEHSLVPEFNKMAPPSTVHWDPHDRNGNKVGWQVRVEAKKGVWWHGRVIRYDPYTHKHMINFESPKEASSWIWLRNKQHHLQLATRMVWAHVKGYAWWPAMVMESVHAESSIQQQRDGYVHVEFFGSNETASLRDTSDFIRPFDVQSIDEIVAKHKKKRNARAYQLACEEYHTIRTLRNECCLYLAERALDLAQFSSPRNFVGKRIELHRIDVNYPYGETLTATVRSYSFVQKKWLLNYDFSERARVKYDACWINLIGKKDCTNVRILEDVDTNELTALLPYMVGFRSASQNDEHAKAITCSNRHIELANLLPTRCRGCVECWKENDIKIHCTLCDAEYHIGCVDPPISNEAWQRMIRDDVDWVCSKCVSCRGCYQKDICYGSHAKSPLPSTLSFKRGEPLHLCFACHTAYDDVRFCPNCAHSWDHERYEKQHTQIDYAGALFRVKGKIGGAGGISPVVDTSLPPSFGSFHGDDKLPFGCKADPSYFYPETTEWGFTEVEMLVCDNCELWVHAGCSGLSKEEYNSTSKGKHPVYSKDFLCRMCCRNRCKELIECLEVQDRTGLFALPVSEKVAPNYLDIIKSPMDLATMSDKAINEEYHNYVWVREMFELMVLNALIFNRSYSTYWIEAKRFYQDSISSVFSTIGKAAPPGEYTDRIQKCFKKADDERKKEEDRVQVDQTVEKKDLVAGSMAASVTLPKLRESPPDQRSCVAHAEVKMKAADAFYCSWMDSCYICGCTGAQDTMLFCVDCGEAYHSFCANAPIHSMDEFHTSGWRCPNCKICEISGDVPQDETRMLFCEMCDRAFSTDLLDPPLSEAPTGLWICGQCVDCSLCCTEANKAGTLNQWSHDPLKCFRCGGCGPMTVADENDSKTLAHTIDSLDSNGEAHLQWLSGQALALVVRGALPTGELCSPAELHVKLVEQICWELSHQWKEDYMNILSEGLRLYGLIRDSSHDARLVVQHALHENATRLPIHVIQRALRFVYVLKRSKWDTPNGIAPERIEVIVQSAKLAAAFLRVASEVLGATLDHEVIASERFALLLQAPDESGQVWFPLEQLRPSVCDSVIKSVLSMNPLTMTNGYSSTSDTHPSITASPKVATPLCGWSNFPEIAAEAPVWNDPRECVLCHLCGDDDAGFVDLHSSVDAPPNGEMQLIHLGRLLPFADGGFVHAGCALWSSEVWEDQSGSVLHAVDKARSRGSQLKCFGCGFYGATVGCNKSNCLFNYHLPCAKACGAVFTTSQHVFCANHRTSALEILDKVTFEPMKTLTIAFEKKSCEKDFTDGLESDQCLRLGALVVHSLGNIETSCDGFHSENYITPPGYMATRIYWSTIIPRTRTLYVLRIEKEDGRPKFFIIPADHPHTCWSGSSVSHLYTSLVERVCRVNAHLFSSGDLLSKLPAIRRTRRKTYGLNGPQFFGFGLDYIRKRLEACRGVEAVVAPLTKDSPTYRFCYMLPKVEDVRDLIRKRAALNAEQAMENRSGCARTEGIKAVTRSGGSGRITRALVRSADEDVVLDGGTSVTAITKKGEEKAKLDRGLTQVKYRRMKSVPLEQRLATRRSHIHGWGLFTKHDVRKDDPIVEYMGEVIRQPMADIREKSYEVSGEGSCYMFRLDLHRIVDATKIGCMARFMNHSCQSNAYAKIISVDTENGHDRKIVVFANRNISAGEEITYDYKFPVEDGSLRCTCGAPNCIGRLN